MSSSNYQEELNELPNIALNWIVSKRGKPPGGMYEVHRFIFLLNSEWSKILRVFKTGLTREELCQLLGWKDKPLDKDVFNRLMKREEFSEWFSHSTDTNEITRYVWKGNRLKQVERVGINTLDRQKRHSYNSSDWPLKNSQHHDDVHSLLTSSSYEWNTDHPYLQQFFGGNNIDVLIGVLDVVDEILTNFRKVLSRLEDRYILGDTEKDELHGIIRKLDNMIGKENETGELKQLKMKLKSIQLAGKSGISIYDRLSGPDSRSFLLTLLGFTLYFVPQSIKLMGRYSDLDSIQGSQIILP
jgi:hypothetical protein